MLRLMAESGVVKLILKLLEIQSWVHTLYSHLEVAFHYKCSSTGRKMPLSKKDFDSFYLGLLQLTKALSWKYTNCCLFFSRFFR